MDLGHVLAPRPEVMGYDATRRDRLIPENPVPHWAARRSGHVERRRRRKLNGKVGGRLPKSPVRGAAKRVRRELFDQPPPPIPARAAAGAVLTVDKFGLPTEWASLLVESEQERSDRQGAALKLLHEVFEVAARHLGEQRIGEEWSRFAQGRAGRPSGPSNPDIDTALLEEWDRRTSQLAPDERRRQAKAIAEDVERGTSDWARALRDRLHGTAKKGTHAGAVEQRIRRALRERDERSATERLMRRAFPDRFRPSLLSWPWPGEET
jgi:hypothetical protein